MANAEQNRRVLSGMRPTGKLHLGHFVGEAEPAHGAEDGGCVPERERMVCAHTSRRVGAVVEQQQVPPVGLDGVRQPARGKLQPEAT